MYRKKIALGQQQQDRERGREIDKEGRCDFILYYRVPQRKMPRF